MSQSYNTVVMPLETTARELNAKILMATALAQQGFRCFIGSKVLAQETARRIGAAIYLDKGYHRGVSEQIYGDLKEAGCLLVSVDEENGVDFKDFHMLNTRMPDDFLAQMDRVLLWGERQNAYLADNRDKYDPLRIRVTGHPRFDLLKERYRDIYRNRAQELKVRYDDFILFNTNSKYSNNINGRQAVIRNYSSRAKGLMKRLEYDDQRLELNLELIRRLAQDLGKTVVVRPHPEEDITTYLDAFADLPSVHAVYEDSAVSWTLAAEGVIHNHSTTGLEAAMLDKTPVAYTPIRTEENFCPWIPIACSHRLERCEDVLAFVKSGGWRDKPSQMDEVLSEYFSFDEDALPKVVATLSELRSSESFSGKSRPISCHHLYQNVRYLAVRLLGREAMSALAANKLKDLRAGEVRQRLFKLLSFLPPDAPCVRLYVRHPHLFEIAPA